MTKEKAQAIAEAISKIAMRSSIVVEAIAQRKDTIAESEEELRQKEIAELVELLTND